MSYIDTFNAVGNPEVQGRCQVAMWRAAQDIAAESDTTPNHAERLDWALRVMQDKANITPRQLVMQVLRNPTIAQDPVAATDGDIQYQINSVIADLIAVG